MIAQLHHVHHNFHNAPAAVQWNGLLAHSHSNIVFLTRQYQEAWWQAFGVTEDCSCTPHILSLATEGNLTGLASFYLAPTTAADVAVEAERQPGAERAGRRAGADATLPPLPTPTVGERVVRLIGGVDVTDYLDVVASPGELITLWRAVFDYWADQRAEWDVIDLHSLPGDSPSRPIVARLAAERGWGHWTAVEETCPTLTLPGDWEDYLAGLDKKSRHELRRKLRKSEGATPPFTWRVVRDPAALPDALEQFIALHRQSNAAKAQFMDERMIAFFRQLVEAMADSSWPDIALLECDGQPVAAYLSFVYGGRVALYNSGYDPRYSEWSTGVVLLAQRIAAAISAHTSCFDFLRGDERYKYDLGGVDHFVHRAIIRQQT